MDRNPLPAKQSDPAAIEVAAAMKAAAFRTALRSFLRRSERVARENGLTPQRLLLLLAIKGAPDATAQATVSDLARRLGLAQSSVTELVKRAEVLGLVERERSETDGRVAHVRLTSEGDRRLAQAFRALEVERHELRDAIAEHED